MGAWDNLSVKEKADIMKVAISNGITNLSDIKQRYNEFAEGGPIEESTFTSELDWSPESWFSKRVAKPDGTYYNEEEAARLASHVPEYLTIEKNAKNNGTWLQNSDGSKWEGDPRSWVMMQSEAYKKNYSAKPWYTGQAEWPTKFDYGQGTVETNKVTRAPYYNEQMWFSDNKDYGDTFANYQNSKGTDWRFDTPGEENIKGQNFLAAIPKKGNYRHLEGPSNSNPDNWQHLPFDLKNNTINRLPAEQIILDSKGRNIRADKQKVLTDDIVNWSKNLGDQGIFMYNVDDGDVIKDGYITPQPVNEFISQPGFTDKVKFIEGNTGDFDINNPYKYAYVPTAQKSGFNIAALGGNLFANGGIHIKPSHRGRLTELKARTGKTEAELYNDGNPAHKKMVVFARNARKWHDLGGNLFDIRGPLTYNNLFDEGGEEETESLATKIKRGIAGIVKPLIKPLRRGISSIVNAAEPGTVTTAGSGYIPTTSIDEMFPSGTPQPVVYKSLTGKRFKTKREAAEDNWKALNKQELYADKPVEYTVKKGDSMWKISHENGIDLNTIRRLNPNIKNDLIHPGDKVIVGNRLGKQLYDVKKEWEKEKVLNTDNLSAIQSIKHVGNYIVIDKLNNELLVYDKYNNVVYRTNDISTGKSGNDYNTITYVNAEGNIISGKGNESTPAGITKITGVGTYHGYPSFTRGRKKGDKFEDLASSLHLGGTKDKKASNGCVRLGKDALNELAKYVGVGTDVYTLPEKKGSKFTVKDGKLNFTADDSYGVDFGINLFKAKPRNSYEKEEDYQEALLKEARSREQFIKKYTEDSVFANKVKGRNFDELYDSEDYRRRFWDDYNVSKDNSYSPITIVSKSKKGKSAGEIMHNKAEKAYINALETNKEELQKVLGMDSDTYNRLALMSLGIAEQESKFNTGESKLTKDLLPDSVYGFLMGNNNRSRGLTQIKLLGDSANEELKKLYEKYGIDNDTINTPEKSALATMLRLGYMYNSEVRGREFMGDNGAIINPYDALLYKWMGRNEELVDQTATPELNNYLQNVKKYQDNYNMYTTRAYGGNLYPDGGVPESILKKYYNSPLMRHLRIEEGAVWEPTDIGDGKHTIGSGLTAQEHIDAYNRKGVWTEEDNAKAMAKEIAWRRKWAEKNVPNWNILPLESQDALLSYKYNYDFNEKNSPKMYQALRNKNWEEVARQMNATSKDPKFINGLTERRKREQRLFLNGFKQPYYDQNKISLNYMTGNNYGDYNDIPYSRTIVRNPEINGASTLINPVWTDPMLQYRDPVEVSYKDREDLQGQNVINKRPWNPIDFLDGYNNLKKVLSWFGIDM